MNSKTVNLKHTSTWPQNQGHSYQYNVMYATNNSLQHLFFYRWAQIDLLTYLLTYSAKYSFVSAVYATANPSVCHMPVLCQKRDAVFTIG